MTDSDVTGEEIAKYLQTTGTTLEDFAVMVGVRASTVWKWKDGRTKKPSRLVQPNLKKILRKKIIKD